MGPDGTFGNEQGIRRTSPPPSPKYSGPSAIPMDPSYNKISGLSKIPTGRTSRSAGGFQQPVGSNIESAIKVYESMAAPPARGRGGQVGYLGDGNWLDEYNKGKDDTSWRDRLYADRANAQNRGGYGGGPAAGNQNQRPSSPFVPLESPDMPAFQADEYKPPGEDAGIYDTERDKAMGAGLRALREGTSEAISTSQSLDNPNARSMFIKKALHGYGQGLESVAAQADRQATSTSQRKHQQAVDTYRTKYEYKRSADLVNYQTSINKIASDFASQQSAHAANYTAGFDQGGQVGRVKQGSPASSIRAAYDQRRGQTPFKGYMG